ncbi:polymeric immunoglobulin receptor-like [Megalobrama amblycephala]|uniref:polymeric immunoglobulin receptor-like n=1 Tax=Megalobrama amblycephala TaxID=75352 RepID=UPI00201414C3|nr:polymeric immunoglobulin receptor-like [Megalobrama amblycephala]
MAAYTKVFYISIGFWLILGVECFIGGFHHVLTIKSGGSVTIPCHYDEKNPPEKKYWYSDIDKSKIYTNTSEENLSVIDHPDQSLFTVTMRNLQYKDTGDYSCVVETEGLSAITYDLYLRVQSAPDVSVVSSSVSGHKGGNVSVQCFYSSRYQNHPKQWCRYKDQRCYTVGRTDTSQNSSVQISDDGRSSFTVLMTGLRLSDSGWFFCSAGEVMNPVHLTVIEDKRRSETGISKKNDKTEVTEETQINKELQSVWLLVSAALLQLLCLAGVFFTWRWKQRSKQDKHQIIEKNDSRTIDPIYCEPEDPVIYNTINDECSNDPIKDKTYSTIGDAPVNAAKPPAGAVIYSLVGPH